MEWFGTPMRPLSGGYSGETFLVGEGDDQLVLRVYQRRPVRAVVDASVLRLVAGIVPVPEIVELRDAHDDDPAVLVTEYLEGVPLDRLLAEPPDDLDWDRLGGVVGEVLARLSSIPFLHAGGFVDADLTVSADGWPSDLREFAQGYRDTERLAAWTDRDWDALCALIDLAEDVLDAGEQRAVLVHSDFNPKNILVDPAGPDPRVVGVLDWEFAHAGSVYTDIGNFSRFERQDRLVGPLVEALVDAAPGQLRAVEMRRAADLWALVDLAGGSPANPVRDLATELLLAQARAGDLEAWPFPADRVSPRA